MVLLHTIIFDISHFLLMKWGDWHKSGPWSVPGLMKMSAPHEQEVFYTLWKHTPPQHPMLACSRPDTLYVVMVRHPKIWEESMRKKPYGKLQK